MVGRRCEQGGSRPRASSSTTAPARRASRARPRSSSSAAGFRVVDTKNADNFNYATTKIVVQRGDVKQGEEIARMLGVGTVEQQPSEQDVADVIVIVGKDYKPPTGGAQGGSK